MTLCRLDFKKYIEWMNDAEVIRFTRHRPGEYDTAKLMEILMSARLIYAIGHKGEMAGVTTLIPMDSETAEATILIGKEYWGRGLARKAFFDLICQAQEMGFKRLVCGCNKKNAPINRVMNRVGFQRVFHNSVHNFYELELPDD